MRGVTSVLASPCLDSLPGPALPSSSRTDGCPRQVFPVVHLKPVGQVPDPAGGNPSASACCGRVWGWCWQASGSLPGQPCSLPALLFKHKCLTRTPVPFHVLSHLSPQQPEKTFGAWGCS